MVRYSPSFKAFLAVFTVLFLLFSVPVHAQTTPEGQKRLEKIFSDLLDGYKDTATSRGATLETEGKILVEPSDNYYAVTLPHITIKKADGAYTEIGMIAINALPGNTPDEWKMTVALPTPIINYDATGAAISKTDIGGQNFSGVWNEKFRNFVKINAQYKDITVEYTEDDSRITIPDARVVYDIEKGDNGLWSGPVSFTISGLKMLFEKSGGTASIDEIKIASDIKDYSLDAALAFQEKMAALSENYDTGGDSNVSGEHILGLYNLISNFVSESLDGFNMNVGIKGFKLTRPPLIPGGPPGLMNIGNGAVGFSMDGFRNGLVALTLNFAYDGFKFEPVPENYSQATPDHMQINLTIGNLPYKDIVKLGHNALQTTVDNPQIGKIAMIQMAASLPQLLTQAQSNLALSNTTIGNNTYNMKMGGKLTANVEALMGATGQAKVEITGIDNLMDALRGAAADPDVPADKKKNIEDTLAGLTIFKMAGQMQKDDAGHDVRVYDFELNKDGHALLNGTDIQMLLPKSKDAAPAKAP